MPGAARVAAIDLGASSGRVMMVTVGPGVLELEEVHRFRLYPEPHQVDGSAYLLWNFQYLLAQVTEGLAKAAGQGPVDAIGVDSWGADFGFIDASGQLLGPVVAYRDDRTEGVEPWVWDRAARPAAPDSGQALYGLTGAAHQRFNTVFQLAAEVLGRSPMPGRLEQADKLLMLPDLVAHHLTGAAFAEVTAASTSGLFDPWRRSWCWPLIDALGLPQGLFPQVVEPGTVVGGLRADLAERLGLAAETPVVAVGGHDTASAVAAVPALAPAGAPDEGQFAYISCGTWSLVGVELPAPVATAAAREANFTNELGLDGTVRFLKNVSGLWLLNECQRAWAAQGLEADTRVLLDQAAALPAGPAFNADDPAFIAPGGMPARVGSASAAAGRAASATNNGDQPNPSGFSQAELTRAIIDSLAASYARAVRQAETITGLAVSRLHVVGGGSNNRLLCRAAATALPGVEVLAGPGEATALGNALAVARGIGAVGGSLADLRRLIADRFPPTLCLPEPPPPGAGPEIYPGTSPDGLLRYPATAGQTPIVTKESLP
ncbi:MAG: hypothetical protein LBH68_06795 [Bifidobacteriaceae bacterium]|jgi:rhamnulokinase|nr:hypothetical protein [Bifidobacteriaceae bacterium]